jgi:hypothetical protein
MTAVDTLFASYEGKFSHLGRPLVAPGGAWGVGKPISIWLTGGEVIDTTEAAIC